MTDKLATRPPVGDFKTKKDNPVRGSTAPTSSTIVQEKEAPSLESTNEMKTATPDAEKTPAELYRERLAEAKISLSHAQTIIDAVLEKDHYEEYFELRGQRGVLRTRSYKDLLRLQKAIDQEKPATRIAQDDLIWRHNLAASLVEWRGKTFSKDSDGAYTETLEYVQSLPAPIFSLLLDQLTKFDNKIMLVFSNGATESF